MSADSLPDDVATLKRLLLARDAELARERARASSTEALIAHLRLTIEKLRREMFGPRSERQARLLDQMELQLEELESTAAEDELASEKAAAATTVRLFTHDPAVVPLAASCLRILSYGNIGYAYGMVMLQAFNGAGDTLTPTIVNFFGFWLLEIPLAYTLAIPLHMRSKGVFLSIVVAEAAIAAAGVMLFKRGRWKRQRI